MSNVRQQVEAFLAEHDPTAEEPLDFLQARFDAGLGRWLLAVPGAATLAALGNHPAG
jgi:hypothetical protein